MAHPYGADYRRRREALIGEPCWACGAPATTADHVPPLALSPPGEWEGRLLPACQKCNYGRRAHRILGAEPTDRAEPQPRRRRVLL